MFGCVRQELLVVAEASEKQAQVLQVFGCVRRRHAGEGGDNMSNRVSSCGRHREADDAGGLGPGVEVLL